MVGVLRFAVLGSEFWVVISDESWIAHPNLDIPWPSFFLNLGLSLGAPCIDLQYMYVYIYTYIHIEY